MALPSEDDCDACVAPGLQRRVSTAVIFSSLPFFVTFLFVATVVFQRLYPLLSGGTTAKKAWLSTTTITSRPNKTTTTTPTSASGDSSSNSSAIRIKRISALTFSTTIGLATVLAELILCEISDALSPAARGLALRCTVSLLLVLLIGVIPSLEIHALLTAAGYRYTGPGAGRLKLAWVLHAAAFTVWLMGFWASGRFILGDGNGSSGGTTGGGSGGGGGGGGWINATTEHVGVIGISLMGLLSGFASVSAPWQSFGARPEPVREASLARKQAGLDSTNEMLAAKRSRLRALEQKMSAAPAAEGFFQKAVGTFRGSSDSNEKKTLEMEVAGLENMSASLAGDHAMLQARFAEQQAAKTARGRLRRVAYQLFSVYCLYRVGATSVTFVRRRLASDPQRFVGSDPINNILALLVKTYDSQLDRQVWTRQISFLLSGVMLCASISSVMQTFHFFSRYLPGLFKAAQANLALIVAQIAGTYVISVALLLRGIMPGELVTDRLKTLGGDNMQWVDGWFEVWFLGGTFFTVFGIWAGRKIAAIDDWDDEVDVELGKIN